MTRLLSIFLLASATLFSQKNVTVADLEATPLKADWLIAIDHFGSVFYSLDHILYKATPHQTLNYSNLQLGTLTSANAFNPLKILLFYKNFNTVVILDNRLSEILKIDFNAGASYKNVSHISTGYDNTLWLFNQDLQQLELFDYKTNTTRAGTMPVASPVLDLKSNYNYSWLLTEKHLYTYSYFGSTLSKLKNDGFLQIAESNGNLVIQKEDGLYFLAKDTDLIRPIQLPQLLIKQFLLTNETLYIYADETLHRFQLKIR